jgi:hypothetical protein
MDVDVDDVVVDVVDIDGIFSIIDICTLNSCNTVVVIT